MTVRTEKRLDAEPATSPPGRYKINDRTGCLDAPVNVTPCPDRP